MNPVLFALTHFYVFHIQGQVTLFGNVAIAIFLQILEFSILPETKFSSMIEAPKIFWAENFGRKSGKIKIVKKKKHVFRFCSIRSKREIKI